MDEDKEKEITILTYVDHSFEQNLTFIELKRKKLFQDEKK